MNDGHVGSTTDALVALMCGKFVIPIDNGMDSTRLYYSKLERKIIATTKCSSTTFEWDELRQFLHIEQWQIIDDCNEINRGTD